MRYFIDTRKHDFWTAIRDDEIIVDRLKPKPYAAHRELSEKERVIHSLREHIMILLISSSGRDTKPLILKSLTNLIIEDFPELAAKHSLIKDTSHEYWRPAP